MCGIAGIWNLNGKPIERDGVSRMVETLAHRGPDGQGTEFLSTFLGPETLGLGHARLSIIDLSSDARQPMSNDDGTLWIVYNGELYNYIELADELRGRGCTFRTASDTEVVLKAYEAFGTECLERFNGMWSFAIWDSRRQRLFCARDRFGEKPFYYVQSQEGFAWASEIKALWQVGGLSPEPDNAVLYRYLAYGYGFADAGEDTFYRGVRQLRPAHYLIVDRNGIRARRYWQVKASRETFAGSEDAYRDEFRARFTRSVRQRLRSDVPVGFCLSGGLDSTSIVCTAARLIPRITTFSVRFHEESFDEGPFIEEVRRQVQASAHEIWFDRAKLTDVLPRMIRHHDEPWSNPNIVANWHIMACARENGIPVLLNGHGGDEVLGGYLPHLLSRQADLMRAGRFARWQREWRFYSIRQKASRAAALARTLRLLGRHATEQLAAACGIRLPKGRHLATAFARGHGGNAPRRRHLPNVLDSEMLEGLEISPLPAWLRSEDRNSMAFGVETRQPFLDHELVEWLFTVPAAILIDGAVSKRLLRRAMQGTLPEPVRLRAEKVGFRTPAEAWFRSEGAALAGDLLSESGCRRRGLLDPRAVERTLREHREGRRNHVFTLWSWLNLELWFRHCVDGVQRAPAHPEWARVNG